MLRECDKPVREVWEGPKCTDVALKRNIVSAVQEGSHFFFTIQEAHFYSFEWKAFTYNIFRIFY
jgi:hypothetical protein